MTLRRRPRLRDQQRRAEIDDEDDVGRGQLPPPQRTSGLLGVSPVVAGEAAQPRAGRVPHQRQSAVGRTRRAIDSSLTRVAVSAMSLPRCVSIVRRLPGNHRSVCFRMSPASSGDPVSSSLAAEGFIPTSSDRVSMGRIRETGEDEKERTGVRILVVEDEPRLASLLRRGLTRGGARRRSRRGRRGGARLGRRRRLRRDRARHHAARHRRPGGLPPAAPPARAARRSCS